MAPDDRKGTGRAVILSAHGLTKIYRMGEVEVHALRGVDIELLAGEFVVLSRTSRSSPTSCASRCCPRRGADRRRFAPGELLVVHPSDRVRDGTRVEAL